MTYLSTAYAALSLGFAGAERWEVVVQKEAHVALVQHVVYQFLIKFGTQRTGRERHSLASLEDSTSVRHGQRAHLAPDGAYLGGLAAVEAHTLIKHTAAHGVAFYVGIIACCLGMLLFQVFLREVGVSCIILLHEVVYQLLEGILALVLGQSLLHQVIGRLIQLVLNLLAKLLVVDFVVILALHVSA